jgi:hypothetical protein
LQSNPRAPVRPSILRWNEFILDFGLYWNVEPASRKDLMKGSARYYSTGELPPCVPTLHTGLPSLVVCETMQGTRTARAPVSNPNNINNPAGDGKKGKA